MNAKVIHRGLESEERRLGIGNWCCRSSGNGKVGFRRAAFPSLGGLSMDRAELTRGSLPTVGSLVFHQSGVKPSLQRRGIGTQLIKAAEDHARANGATEIACDTAEGAIHLISLSQESTLIQAYIRKEGGKSPGLRLITSCLLIGPNCESDQ